MIQICYKEKVYNVICTGKIDAAEISFLNLMGDLVLIMKKQCLLELLPCSLEGNCYIPFDILIALAVTAKMKL